MKKTDKLLLGFRVKSTQIKIRRKQNNAGPGSLTSFTVQKWLTAMELQCTISTVYNNYY